MVRCGGRPGPWGLWIDGRRLAGIGKGEDAMGGLCAALCGGGARARVGVRGGLVCVVVMAALVFASGAQGVAVAKGYWANARLSAIGVADLDGSGVNQSFITGAGFPSGVAVDGEHIYWANFGSGTIGVANVDGNGVNQSFITGASEPYGLAVDGQHIYWANFGSGTIGVANLDGSG